MDQNDSKSEQRSDRPGRVVFDSAKELSSGFETWHELCRPVFEVESLEGEGAFQSAFDFIDIDGLAVNRTRYSATRYVRTPAHVRADACDGLALHLLLSGRELGEVNGQAFQTSPDRVVLQDWSQPFVKESTAAEQVSVVVPAHLIPAGRRPSADQPVLSWSLESGAGRLLASAIHELYTAGPSLEAGDAPATAAGFLGLLDGLLSLKPGVAPDGGQFDRATFVAMKAFVLQRLAEPDLGVDNLVAAFGCSRSTVYRLFKSHGGVRAFIQGHRLEATRRELVRADHADTVIRRVAERYGFHDPAYFHRLFKKQFGRTPADAMRDRLEVVSLGQGANEVTGRIRAVHSMMWIEGG
ncbi:MAG: AraC family transcriptional regulator [Planctomycetota bacterium]